MKHTKPQEGREAQPREAARAVHGDVQGLRELPELDEGPEAAGEEHHPGRLVVEEVSTRTRSAHADFSRFSRFCFIVGLVGFV